MTRAVHGQRTPSALVVVMEWTSALALRSIEGLHGVWMRDGIQDVTSTVRIPLCRINGALRAEVESGIVEALMACTPWISPRQPLHRMAG